VQTFTASNAIDSQSAPRNSRSDGRTDDPRIQGRLWPRATRRWL